jgi:hypothetical protein
VRLEEKLFRLHGKLKLKEEGAPLLVVNAERVDFEDLQQALASLRDRGPFHRWAGNLEVSSGSARVKIEVRPDGSITVPREAGWLGRLLNEH